MSGKASSRYEKLGALWCPGGYRSCAELLFKLFVPVRVPVLEDDSELFSEVPVDEAFVAAGLPRLDKYDAYGKRFIN